MDHPTSQKHSQALHQDGHAKPDQDERCHFLIFWQLHLLGLVRFQLIHIQYRWDRRLDARLAAAMMGIQAIKGVEVGDGFTTATRRGSVAHDEIERGPDGAIRRRTDRAGGTEGGMSNGEILRVRAAMKPISTVPKALDTIDVKTGEAAKAINQRSDVCAVPAAGVVAEAMVALVLAEAVLEKFGGDSVGETKRNFESYIAHLSIK